ncbi:MAG TPA: hypothetical protein VFK35_12750 [Candidatus Limnocylindrales bacterium]|nr:hypothetical protein [Candidatus Limnocylindrales bacterium]
MTRLLALVAALALALGLALPVLAADGDVTPTGRVLFASGGELTVPAGEVADTVIVVDGHAEILGRVDAVVVLDGTAAVRSTTIESLLVIRGSATVTDSHVLGDIRTFDAQVSQVGVTLDGSQRGLETDLIALGWVIGIGALLIWLGVGLSALVSGLLVAALAGRQIRATAAIIRREPLRSAGAGLLGLILPPLVAAALAATIIGIPMALGVLLVAWPTLAFVGYIVAAVWVGEWVLERFRGRSEEPERPYLATIVGMVVMFVVGIVPLLTAVLSLLGLGAVVLAAWRTFRGGPVERAALHVSAAPMAS